MAVKPTNNDVFLREVDEELRRDQMAEFGKRWGIAIVIAVIAALCAFGGYLYWQHHRAVVAGEQGETLQQAYDALANEQPAKASAPLATLADSSARGISRAGQDHAGRHPATEGRPEGRGEKIRGGRG